MELPYEDRKFGAEFSVAGTKVLDRVFGENNKEMYSIIVDF